MATFEKNKNDSRIRIMLIDDHQTMLWGLQQLIGSHDRTMVVAGATSSVDDAAVLAAEVAPDIILLDMDLGERSGLDLIPELLARTNAKILMLTGMRDQAILDAAIVAGAKGVVRKEESAVVLLDAIQKVHSGQVWMDRDAIGRVFEQMQRKDAKNQKVKSLFAVLTRREHEILTALVQEPKAPNKTLAKQLELGEHTLRNHLSVIYQKLGVDSRIELYLLAIEHDYQSLHGKAS